MNWRVRLRLFIEKIVALPVIVLAVLLGFRPFGGGVRRA
jgi:hypothetical protein